MAFAVKVNGASRNLLEDSVYISDVLNERSTASFTIVSDTNENIRVTKREPVEIGTTGKNIFNRKAFYYCWKEDGYPIYNGTNWVIGSYYYFQWKATSSISYTLTYNRPNAYFVSVKPSTTYTLSCTVTDPTKTKLTVFYYNKKGDTEPLDSYSVTGSNVLTFTTGSTTNFVNVRFEITEVDFTNRFEEIMIEEGNTATTYEPYPDVIFNGFVDVAVEKQVGANGSKRIHQITCVDNHYLVDKRIYAGAFENQTVTYIVNEIAEAKLVDEGIQINLSFINGGDDTTIAAITFNYMRVSECFDKLAERSGCEWWVDDDKFLHFEKTGALWSSKVLVDSMIKNGSLSIENNAHQYRNRQIIKGGRSITDSRTENFMGDGETRTFTVGYPLAKKPVLKVNDTEVNTSLIGIKGLDDDDGTYDWFWAKNSNEITQANNDTPLTSSQKFTVVYQGYYATVIVAQQTLEIEELAAKDGSTGIVEALDNEPNLDSKDEIYNIANSKLNKFAQTSTKISFVTLDDGFLTGYLVGVNIPSEGIINDHNYLVESVDIYEQYPVIWYKVTLVKGFIHDSWAKVFGRFSSTFVDTREDTALVEMVILPVSKEKTWYVGDIPNTMRDTYPGSGLIVGSANAYPMLAPSERNVKMKVKGTGDVVLATVDVVERDYYSGYMVSFFIVPTNMGEGEWIALEFWGGSNGQTKMLTVTETRTKTKYDEIQVTLTDYKGW